MVYLSIRASSNIAIRNIWIDHCTFTDGRYLYFGYQFVDRGSWVNGRPADLVAVAARKFDAAASAARSTAEANGTAVPEWATMPFTTDVGRDPADEYSYRPLRSAAAVTATVLREAGAGRVR